MIEFRAVKKDELHEVARLVAGAFEKYPIYELILRDAFDDRAGYMKYMEKANYVHLKANYKKHVCMVGIQDGKIVCTALLKDPKEPHDSIPNYIKAGAIKLVSPIGLRRLMEFTYWGENEYKDCEREYPNAWFLDLLAVDSSLKGQGIGSRMLQECVNPFILSKKEDTLTVVTHTEENRIFYAKNGYREFAGSTNERNGLRITNWSLVTELQAI